MCAAKLNGGDLTCDRLDPHEPHHGCTYASTSAIPTQEKSDGGGSDD
jgi:hypothetical protein